MATADTRSFVDQVKEMRALRMQQLKQMSAEQRYQNSMMNYQRSVIRSNEKIAASISNLGSKLTSTVTGLINAIGRTGGAAVGGAVSGVSNMSNSIVSGLNKVLPLAIAGLLAKVMLWDNMSGDTQSKLTKAFGKLFGKLFSYLEDSFDSLAAGILRTVQQIRKAYEGLDIKFPMLDKIGKKLGIFFEIVSESMKVVSSYAEEMFGFVKDNPKTALAAALGAYLSPQILAVLGSIVAGVVTTTIFKAVMTRHMAQLITATGAGGAMASGRTLAESMGTKGAADFAARTGISLADNVYVGEGGQAIVDASGKAILRTSPAMTPGQKIMGGVRSIASRGLSVAARGLNIAGVALLAVEPSGGGLDFESWEMENAGIVGAKTSDPNRDKFMTNDDDSNMVALAYALRDAGNERKASNDLKPGSLLVVSKNFVYRARDNGKGGVRMLRMVIGTLSPETVDFPDVTRESRTSYEKMVEDLKTQLIRDNDVQIAPESSARGGEVPGANAVRTSAPNISSLADFIRKYESGPSGYNQMFLKPDGKPYVETSKPISEMTVGEIKELQRRQVAETKKAGVGKSDETGEIVGTGAIGKYQFTQKTLAKLLKDMGVKDDEIFGKALQDKLFVKLIGQSYQDYMDGTIGVDKFVEIVKKQWAAFRVPKAEKELKDYLVKLKKDAGADNAVMVDEKGQIIPKTQVEREKALKRIKELLPELMKDDDILNTPIITSKGEDVIKLVKDRIVEYADERTKRIEELKKVMESQKKAADPKELMSELLETLDILDSVNGATNSSDRISSGDTINYNISDNSSSSVAGSSRSRGVYPVYSFDRTAHITLTGIGPYRG